jgi:group I intron endonuclease
MDNTLRTYVIYRLTSPSGKAYIGQTRNNVEKRWNAHRYQANEEVMDKHYAIHKAIRKYGWENFTKEVMMVCDYEWELNEWEKIHIAEYNTLSPNGYNLTEGGWGGIPCDETRKKMSESAKLRPPPAPAERKNGLDQNLPKFVQYVPGRSGYKLEGHPNCKTRSFYDSNLTIEEKKRQCLDFLAQLDNGLVIEDKPARTLPKYIHKVANGYSIHIGNKTIKTFQKKSNTLEHNLQLTIDYLSVYMQQNKL